MNIAVGTPIECGKILGTFVPIEYILRLMKEKFNGYVCLTIAGKTGFEEGVLLFHNGVIRSSDYEYYKYNKKHVAEEGLVRTLNAFLAEKGILDCFSLTPYQIQLILTLNEECNLRKPVDGKENPLTFPTHFSPLYEEQLAKEQMKEEETREWVLKKHRLAKLATPETTRKELYESAKKEEKSLKELLEE
jgi:hypothetical protein